MQRPAAYPAGTFICGTQCPRSAAHRRGTEQSVGVWEQRRGLWPSAPMEWPATTVRRACVSTDLNKHNTITAPASRSSNSYVQARHICSYRRWVPSFLPEPAQKVQKKRQTGAGAAAYRRRRDQVMAWRDHIFPSPFSHHWRPADLFTGVSALLDR